MKAISYFVLLFILPFSFVFSQQDSSGYVVKTEIIDGDTLPMLILDEVMVVYTGANAPTGKAGVKYSKLIRDVKKVYPYALIAGAKYEEYAKLLANIPDKNEQRKIMKQAEDDMREKFEDDLKKLTLTQGKILVKLVYRQTNNTSYELVKEFRGSFRAVFWQSIGKIFGVNLKVKYDPEGEDKHIEDIVKKIENGTL